MSRQRFVLVPGTMGRRNALEAVKTAPDYYEVEVRQKTRSPEQNARMWAMLGEISVGIPWHGQRLTPEEWKDVFTAALNRQKVVPGIDGGFVVIGARTSTMTKKEMSDLIELMHAFAAERDLVFSWDEPAQPMEVDEDGVITNYYEDRRRQHAPGGAHVK